MFRTAPPNRTSSEQRKKMQSSFWVWSFCEKKTVDLCLNVLMVSCWSSLIDRRRTHDWRNAPTGASKMPRCRMAQEDDQSWELMNLVDRGKVSYGDGSIPINTIFRGMNIHLPAILMFTRGTRFWHTAIWRFPDIGVPPNIIHFRGHFRLGLSTFSRKNNPAKLGIPQLVAGCRW